jgi:hypothetical protein
MKWHIVDHGSFQRATAAVVGTGAAVAGVAWAWPLARAPWWVGTSVVAATALFTGIDSTGRIRVIGALPAGILAGLIAWALIGWSVQATLAEALVSGALAGLGATLAVGALHLRRNLARATVDPGSSPLNPPGVPTARSDDELGARARAAHARIVHGLEDDARPEMRRLRDLSEQVTGRVLDLLGRGRVLHEQVRVTDADAVNLRAAALETVASTTIDQTARQDLSRAARAARELHDRVRVLEVRLARVRARAELQVTLLESAALGIMARGASAAADQMEALGPLGDSLHEAGRDLDHQLEAMEEVLHIAPRPDDRSSPTEAWAPELRLDPVA